MSHFVVGIMSATWHYCGHNVQYGNVVGPQCVREPHAPPTTSLCCSPNATPERNLFGNVKLTILSIYQRFKNGEEHHTGDYKEIVSEGRLPNHRYR